MVWSMMPSKHHVFGDQVYLKITFFLLVGVFLGLPQHGSSCVCSYTSTTLDCATRSLKSLPKCAVNSSTTAATFLDLYLNQLNPLQPGVFESFTALTKLVLERNQLTSLPLGVLDSLTTLTYLDLDFNPLRSLRADVFNNLTNLEILLLQVTEITSLPAGIFNRLTALKKIWLNRNNLKFLPAGLFENNILEEIYLQVNPLVCSPSVCGWLPRVWVTGKVEIDNCKASCCTHPTASGCPATLNCTRPLTASLKDIKCFEQIQPIPGTGSVNIISLKGGYKLRTRITLPWDARLGLEETNPAARVHTYTAEWSPATTTSERWTHSSSVWDACPVGSEVHNGFCYTFYQDMLTNEQAAEECTNASSYLLTIASQEEADFLFERFSGKGRRLHLGLKRQNDTFKWADNNVFNTTGYVNWMYGQPDHLTGQEGCVQWLGDFQGQWRDAPCHENRTYICKKPIDQACAEPQNLTNGIINVTGTTVNATAVFSCNTGYELGNVGSPVSTCMKDGSWSGPSPVCNDINECAQSPHVCMNNGTCHNGIGDYVCICPSQFTGKHCEIKVDQVDVTGNGKTEASSNTGAGPLTGLFFAGFFTCAILGVGAVVLLRHFISTRSSLKANCGLGDQVVYGEDQKMKSHTAHDFTNPITAEGHEEDIYECGLGDQVVYDEDQKLKSHTAHDFTNSSTAEGHEEDVYDCVPGDQVVYGEDQKMKSHTAHEFTNSLTAEGHEEDVYECGLGDQVVYDEGLKMKSHTTYDFTNSLTAEGHEEDVYDCVESVA